MNYYKTEWTNFKTFYKKDFLISIALIFISAIVTYFLLGGFMDEANLKLLKQGLGESFESKGFTSDLSHTEVALYLFLNNTRAMLFSLVMGLVPLLFLPYFAIILNGAIIGFVLFLTTVSGESLLAVFGLGILPHGVTEITAMCLSASLGLHLCKRMTKKLIPALFKDKTEEAFSITLKRTLKTFVFVAFPLIVVSALIEGYITPLLLGLVR